MQVLRPLVRPAPTRLLLAAMVGSLVAVAALAGSMAGSAASGNDNRLAASLASSAPTASSALGSGASVDAKVVKQVATHGQTTFWVILREQANLAPRAVAAPVPEGAVRLQLIDVHGRPHAGAAESVARSAPRALQVFLDPQLAPGDGGPFGAALRSPPAPRWRRSFPTSTSGSPRVTPGPPRVARHRRVGAHQHQRPSGLDELQRSRRGHRRRKHRHRCPLHAQRACHEVPRPEHRRDLQPQLQLE